MGKPVKRDWLLKRIAETSRLIDEARGRILQDGNPRGAVKCPKCGGLLQYRVAENGHVHAVCITTNACLRWME